MPSDKALTVYVEASGLDEVKSMMQDAATEIGALRAVLADARKALSFPEDVQLRQGVIARIGALIDGDIGAPPQIGASS